MSEPPVLENTETSAERAHNGAVIGVADDDPLVRRTVTYWLQASGYRTVQYASGREVIDAAQPAGSVICLDLGLGDMSGLDVLRHLRGRDSNISVIVVTAERAVDTAVEAMRHGAYDYLVKPIDREHLLQVVHRAVERQNLLVSLRNLEEKLDQQKVLGAIVGESAAMRELGRQIERVLDSVVTVTLLGESGTGKEVVAAAIHSSGRRRRGPFIAINCAAIPEALQESELFGHERGAFTGASGQHKGRIEQANGGTLFLDELGEMSASTQASLLRTLQERTIRRVGGTTEIPVDVRIVCATHRDLGEMVRAGKFREDLFFRLVVYPIAIPPLRARLDDVPLLVAHFLRKFRDDVGRDITGITPDAMDVLRAYPWPGNVRELQNVVHRSMLACDGAQIDLEHLPRELVRATLPPLPPLPVPGAASSAALWSEEPIVPLRDLEKRAISRALQASAGNVGKAAKLLGIGRATLYRRLSELEIEVKQP